MKVLPDSGEVQATYSSVMWGASRRRFTLTFLSLNLTQFQFPCPNSNPFHYTTRIVTTHFNSPEFHIFRSSFSSSIYQNRNTSALKLDNESNINKIIENSKEEEEEGEEEEEDDDDNDVCDDNPDGQLGFKDQSLSPCMETIFGISVENGNSIPQFKTKLEKCGITPSSDLVVEVLSRLRNDWESAFTFFLWAAKQTDYVPSLREYHSMISILAKMRKFDTAWSLINEMRGGRNGKSLVTPKTLLILIRRYCALHEVGKAINTFYAHKLFKFDVGMEEFHDFLSALCRYKNVKDAEHLLFCNESVFPFNTKSFNIILNGWCNIVCSPREAKRIWREMSERGVSHDVVSYSSIISCYSKSSNLHEVLKLFNQMKELGISPDRKVYNAVIHALAKGRLLKDAKSMLKTMEEKGFAPNVVTYNSLIKPLCRARHLDEAREVLHEMLQRGLSPTIRTYHAFFQILRTGEEVFALLEKMNKVGCCPNNDTYIMLIRKFCRWRQLDDVFKLWSEMRKNGGPDRSSYVALIHGLFLNGKLEEAYKYNQEMKERRFLPEPKLDEMLQKWVSEKQIENLQMIDSKDSQVDLSQSGNESRFTSRKFDRERDLIRQPKTRSVVRERGFSLRDH